MRISIPITLLVAASAVAQPFSHADHVFRSSVNRAVSSVDLTTGLVAYWKFDETSGSTGSDSNGGTNTLTYSGSVGSGIFIGNGHLNNCFTNTALVGFTNRLAKGLPVYNTTGYSLSFWVKPLTTANVYYYTESGSSAYFILGTYATSGYFQLYIYDDTGTSKLSYTVSSSAPPLGVWTHVVWTDSAGSCKLYTNGVLMASPSYTTSPSTMNVATVGAYTAASGSQSGPSPTVFDEFRVYKIVLNTNQINALYNL